jgi:predicted thioesterase
MIEVGTTGEASLTVNDTDLASALGSADLDLPDVFATPCMIALMELAAANALLPELKPGQVSVGASISARHLAATPEGVAVTAKAIFLGMEGKLYKFRIEAYDPGGKIGEGEHSRAIVSKDRLMQAARTRMDTNGNG